MIIDPSFQGGEQHLGVQRWWLQRHNPVESQSGQRNLTLLPVFSGVFFFDVRNHDTIGLEKAALGT